MAVGPRCWEGAAVSLLAGEGCASDSGSGSPRGWDANPESVTGAVLVRASSVLGDVEDVLGGAAPCVSSGLSSRPHLSPICTSCRDSGSSSGPYRATEQGLLLPINICRWVVLLVLLCSHEGSLYLQPAGVHGGRCSGSVLPSGSMAFLPPADVCLWAAVIQLNFFLLLWFLIFMTHAS